MSWNTLGDIEHYPLEDQPEEVPTGDELVEIINNEVRNITGANSTYVQDAAANWWMWERPEIPGRKEYLAQLVENEYEAMQAENRRNRKVA